jgi:ABC-type polar amino acid transport system ATPase subunit
LLQILPFPPVHQAQLNRQQVDITLPKADIMKIRQKVGMVFQHFHLFPHMTVLQNVIYAPVKVKQIAKNEARHKGL